MATAAATEIDFIMCFGPRYPEATAPHSRNSLKVENTPGKGCSDRRASIFCGEDSSLPLEIAPSNQKLLS
jgi:hypothetical protein